MIIPHIGRMTFAQSLETEKSKMVSRDFRHSKGYCDQPQKSRIRRIEYN